jgi:ketosteroid isomerase-like protein
MSAAEIAANNRAFEDAVATGNIDAIDALLAPGVMALPPDGPIVAGKEEVKQLWASAIREHGMKSCRISSDQLDFAGDMASEVGHATMTMAPPGGSTETTAKIKFVVVWKRLDGKWLLYRDIWNAAA